LGVVERGVVDDAMAQERPILHQPEHGVPPEVDFFAVGVNQEAPRMLVQSPPPIQDFLAEKPQSPPKNRPGPDPMMTSSRRNLPLLAALVLASGAFVAGTREGAAASGSPLTELRSSPHQLVPPPPRCRRGD